MRPAHLAPLLVLAVACGNPAQPAAAPAPSAAASTPAATAPPTPPAPTTPPIDLLHAVESSVAVSSVYRDRAEYAARLVDGDLGTAWNGRSGELEGAAIELRLPEAVEVTALALTVGFTRQSDTADLFTGNRRVAQIRVSREGQPLGTFRLDPNDRALQTVALTGRGGTYRIEVVETVPGTRDDWREVCISELQVLGRSPLAHEGERTPRTYVGALPPPPLPVDMTEFRARFAATVATFERAFIGYEWAATRAAQSTDPEVTLPDRIAAAAQLETIARRLASALEGVDGLGADRVRRLTRPPVAIDVLARGAQLTTMVAALEAIADTLATPEARCVVARANAHIRFERIAAQGELDRFLDEVDSAFGNGGGRANNPTANTSSGAPETRRESQRLVNQARALYARSPSAALASLDGHPVERVSPDVAPLLTALRAIVQHCPAAP